MPPSAPRPCFPVGLAPRRPHDHQRAGARPDARLPPRGARRACLAGRLRQGAAAAALAAPAHGRGLGIRDRRPPDGRVPRSPRPRAPRDLRPGHRLRSRGHGPRIRAAPGSFGPLRRVRRPRALDRVVPQTLRERPSIRVRDRGGGPAYGAASGPPAASLRFPIEDARARLVLAKSDFTHLLAPEAARYLAETRRALEPGSAAVVTAFLFDRNAPEMELVRKHFPSATEMASCAGHSRAADRRGGLRPFDLRADDRGGGPARAVDLARRLPWRRAAHGAGHPVARALTMPAVARAVRFAARASSPSPRPSGAPAAAAASRRKTGSPTFPRGVLRRLRSGSNADRRAVRRPRQ